MSANRKWLVILFALFGLVPIVNEAYAIVGRPLTPVSVAGRAQTTMR